jgi:hypothetical protein
MRLWIKVFTSYQFNNVGFHECNVIQSLCGSARAERDYRLDSWATILKQDYFNNSWPVTLLHRIRKLLRVSDFKGRAVG